MQAIDRQPAQQFPGKLLNIYAGAMLSALIDIGYRTGLFEAAAKGPATSPEIAERAGLQERYTLEWLGGMATGGIFTYDPVSQAYTLPPEHAAFLTGNGARNLSPMSRIFTLTSQYVPKVTEAFQQGGGVPYADYRPEFTEVMDDLWRRIYDEQLLTGFLPVAKGIPERLAAGIRVADIGCGTGHAINLMARAYPHSNFFGYDLATDAITKAVEEARAIGLANARFEALDVSRLPAEPKFELITTFDTIHDQVEPASVLRCVHEALRPDGIFLMVDFKFSSNVEDNIGNPFAPVYYGVSTLHCLTVSLAEGGAGLGTVWGIQRAQQMLAEAGFTAVEVVDAPRPQNCVLIGRK
jgi:SAM-dependent methyltransferase